MCLLCYLLEDPNNPFMEAYASRNRRSRVCFFYSPFEVYVGLTVCPR